MPKRPSGRFTSSSTTPAATFASLRSMSHGTTGIRSSRPICAARFLSPRPWRRGMIARGYGRIVNIGSVTSVFGYAGLAPYGASRGGVRQLTMSLADEWGKSRSHRQLPRAGMVQDRAEQGSLRKPGVGRLHHRPHSRQTPRPAARSRWSRGVSRLRIQPLRNRPDAAGGRRHLDRLDTRHRGSSKATVRSARTIPALEHSLQDGFQ